MRQSCPASDAMIAEPMHLGCRRGYHPAMGRLPRAARRYKVACMIGCTLFAAAVVPAQAQPTTAPSVDAAVQRGLEYLAKRQNADGSFDSGENRVALTGLSVMAFLACGQTPEAGRYGLVVRGGIDFLLGQSQPDGYYGKSHGKGMYDQGIVTLALADRKSVV